MMVLLPLPWERGGERACGGNLRTLPVPSPKGGRNNARFEQGSRAGVSELEGKRRALDDDPNSGTPYVILKGRRWT